MNFLSSKIFNFIKKYLFHDTFLSNLPIEITYSVGKYMSIEGLKYLNKTNLNFNWNKFYYYLYNNREIYSAYKFPFNTKNKYLNAIINKTSNTQINNTKFEIKINKKIYDCYYADYLIRRFDKKENLFEKIPNNRNVKKVFYNNQRIILLLKDSTIMTCGWNIYGWLGTGDNITRNKFEHLKDIKGNIIKGVVDVCCVYESTLLLLKNGKVMACGYSSYGKLGFGDVVNRRTFEVIPGLKNVVGITGCDRFIIVLLKDGTIMSCGNNSRGQLGLNDFKDRSKFEFIPYVKNVVKVFINSPTTNEKYYSVIILLETGEIMACGYNGRGQLGLNDSINHERFEYVKYKKGENINNVSNVFCQNDCIFVLLKNGKLLASGENEYGDPIISGNNIIGFKNHGKLGIKERTKFDIKNKGLNEIKKIHLFEPVILKFENKKLPFSLHPNKKVINIFTSENHSVILLNTGEIMVCGENGFGQLGLNDLKNRKKFEFVKNINNVISVSCYQEKTIILLKTGEVMMCGLNNNEFLSDSNINRVSKFTFIKNPKEKTIKDITCIGIHSTMLLDKFI